MPTLRIHLLGDFLILSGDTPVTAVNTPRLQSLLAYIILHNRAPQPRNHLAFSFWPDSSETHAQLSLRKLLHQLRYALPEAETFLDINSRTLQWRSGAPFSLDVAEFEHDLECAKESEHRADKAGQLTALRDAIEHYRGDLLPGFYDEWVLGERERLRQAFLEALERLIMLLEGQTEYGLAIDYAQRLLRHDPLREESYRLLMRLYAVNGDRPSALRVYNRCVTLLQRELGVEPGPATQELYNSLRPPTPYSQQPVPTRPRSTNARAALPVQTTTFVGRERELAEATALLRRPEVRLVTFTGAAGTGKTRLALEVASDLVNDYAHGTAFVSLASISDHALVMPAIAQHLGVRESKGSTLFESLLDFLRDKHMLLVIDNFEHLLEAAPTLAELPANCPDLTLLVTSRALLHLRGEHEYTVPPLRLPELDKLQSSEELAQSEAVSLFLERIVVARPDFALTNNSARALAEICARLDGLPLAIELMAARTRILSPQAILERLSAQGGTLKLLVGGARDLPRRQQALRTAIAWSYDLLSLPEMELFNCIGVFSGGCSLEAVEAVGTSIRIDILDGLQSLVDKSLIRIAEYGALDGEHDGSSRFWMLETLREYALERLAESGRAEEIRRLHAEYYLAMAEMIEPNLRGHQQKWLLDQLEGEHDNFRSALEWLATHGQYIDGGLQLAGALGFFWQNRYYWSEGRQWLKRLLDAGTGSPPVRAVALHWLGRLCNQQGDYEEALLLHREGLALCREVGDKKGTTRALLGLASGLSDIGDLEASKKSAEEALSLSYDTGDKHDEAAALQMLGYIAIAKSELTPAVSYLERCIAILKEIGNNLALVLVLDFLGWALFRKGDYLKARVICEEAIALSKEIGDINSGRGAQGSLAMIAQELGDYTLAITLLEENLADERERGSRRYTAGHLNNLGYIKLFQGDFSDTRRILEESLRLFLEIGNKVASAHPCINLGHLALLEGRNEDAETLLKKALRIASEVGANRPIAECLEFLGETSVSQGDIERAAILFGAGENLREVIGDPLRSYELAEYEQYLASAREALAPDAYASAWARGRSMPLDEVIIYALED